MDQPTPLAFSHEAILAAVAAAPMSVQKEIQFIAMEMELQARRQLDVEAAVEVDDADEG